MSGRPAIHFDRYGCTYQLRIRSADDLEQILDLDDSLWIAVSAPVAGLNCDEEFLELVDLDSNGRIRADELRRAVQYLLKRLADRSRIGEGTDKVPLAALETSHTEGRRLGDTARYILDSLRAEQQETISVAQIEAFRESLDNNVINGDRVIAPEASTDEMIQQFIAEVASCTGGREDLTGQTGITDEDLDRFLSEARAYLGWIAQADVPDGQGTTEITPLGQATSDAYQAFAVVRLKVEDFFARCRMLRFCPRAHAEVCASLAAEDPAALSDAVSINRHLAGAPLAEPNAEGLLPLRGSVNPAHQAGLEAFAERVLKPTVGDTADLSEEQWDRVKALFAPHEQWLAERQGADVEELGRQKLQLYLDGPHAEVVRALIAADKEVARRLAEARELKKLLLYHRYLLPLANNFVSFPDLYDPPRRALFEMGSLVIDGRWFSFAVKVDDLDEHSDLAKTSGMYVMYVELRRRDDADRLIVATPATSGTVGNLCVGKRGVFYDTAGRHYDARVVRIIENPISFREALCAPFVRLGRFIAGKIGAISGSTQKEMESQVGRATQQVQAGVQETVRQAPQVARQAPPAATELTGAQASASRRDLLVGASVSVAALSSAFAFVASKLSDALEKPWHLAVAVLVIVLVVLLPTAVAAGIKLSRRDLSAILEGCGWAINARMRLNRHQRRQFTRYDGFPPDATGTPRKRWTLPVLVFLLLVLIVIAAVRFWPPGGEKAPPAVPQETPVQAVPGPSGQ